MLLLVTCAHPTLARHLSPSLGRLVQPRHYSSVRLTAGSGMPWAADNDCFQRLDPDGYYRMLDALVGLPGCLFVTVPDVVADAAGTLRGWVRWSEGLRRRGLPIAFVAQDGCERGRLPPWWAFDALFLGGRTEWKLGPHARALTALANAHGSRAARTRSASTASTGQAGRAGAMPSSPARTPPSINRSSLLISSCPERAGRSVSPEVITVDASLRGPVSCRRHGRAWWP
jgi:hypothetical protein